MVETTGVEPVVPFGRRIYSPLGLPIFLHLQINTFVKTYKNITPSGLTFCLSLSDTGVCCIIVYDVFDCEAQLRYFTDINRAMRFINNL